MEDIDRMIGEYTDHKIYFIKQNGEQMIEKLDYFYIQTKHILYCQSSPSYPFWCSYCIYSNLTVMRTPLALLVDYFSKDDWSMFMF